MNKQSNTYTIIYIIVLVVVVGTALALTAMSLKDRQQANADADKMRQILASVKVVPEKNEIISDLISTSLTNLLLTKTIISWMVKLSMLTLLRSPKSLHQTANSRFMYVHSAMVQQSTSCRYMAQVFGDRFGDMYPLIQMALPSMAHISRTKEKHLVWALKLKSRPLAVNLMESRCSRMITFCLSPLLKKANTQLEMRTMLMAFQVVRSQVRALAL